ncbi:hypothetical protein BASA81_015302 [Batrachochytrium salamandrivorans]|nr:hypothetical protein BASA81_015302 [Batrachochytrium salamandrivorans]
MFARCRKAPTAPAVSTPRPSPRHPSPPLAEEECLVSSRAGKSCLVYSALTADSSAWLTHPVRVKMLVPALRLEVVKMQRHAVLAAVLDGSLVVEDQTLAVQQAIWDVTRPMHASEVDPGACLLLYELLGSEIWEAQRDYQWVLGKGYFPRDWFSTQPTVSHAQVLTCMPSSLAECEVQFGKTKVIDTPNSFFSLLPVTASTMTTAAYVMGLHSLRARLAVECDLVHRAYAQACAHKVGAFALVFTQVDIWPQGSFAELGQIVAELVSMLRNLPVAGPRIPIKLAVVNCLDECSARVCLKELGLATCDLPYRREFLPHGIAPHMDRELTQAAGTTQTARMRTALSTPHGAAFVRALLYTTPCDM